MTTTTTTSSSSSSSTTTTTTPTTNNNKSTSKCYRTPDLNTASSSNSISAATTSSSSSNNNAIGSSSNSLLGVNSSMNNTSSSSGGLKFSYEAQTISNQLDVPMLPASAIKDSPPSSPGSEIGAALHTAIAAPTTASSNVRKRGRKAKDATLAAAASAAAAATATATQPDLKDVRILQNGIGAATVPASTPTPPATPATSATSVSGSSTTSSSGNTIITHTATHMLGNHVNPNSSVAQKLSEQLHMEVQDHAIYTSDPITSQFVGVPFPGKQVNTTIQLFRVVPLIAFPLLSQRNANAAAAAAGSATPAPNPLQSMFGGGGINGNMPIPQSLEQLLERQWEQGSQFLMEQAQHFDSEYG